MRPSFATFLVRTGSSFAKHADAHAAIRAAFDAPGKAATAGPAAGIFRHRALRQPADFVGLVRKTQRRADAIVSRMLDYAASTATDDAEPSSSDHAHAQVASRIKRERDLLVQVKQIDRLSDLLCGVIDLAEVIRNINPDPTWVQYADAAYQELCYYMNQLNTHVGLYKVRRTYLMIPETLGILRISVLGSKASL